MTRVVVALESLGSWHLVSDCLEVKCAYGAYRCYQLRNLLYAMQYTNDFYKGYAATFS